MTPRRAPSGPASRLFVALVAGTTLLGACTAGSQPTGSQPTGSGLTGSVVQFREDEVRDQLRVRLIASAATTVHSVQLRWAGFAPADPVVVDYPLSARVPVDLPIPLPPASCGRPARADTPPPPMTAADVTATVTLGAGAGAGAAPSSGVGSTATVPLADAAPTLSRVYARSCRAQALAAAVDIGFGDSWALVTADGLPARRGSLEVTARPGTAGAVRVLAVDGSVLLAVTVAPGAVRLPAAVPPGPDGGLGIPIDVTTTGRCDGHALGESKQTYVFDVTVDADGARGLTGPQPVTVSVPPDAQPLLWETLQAACAAR